MRGVSSSPPPQRNAAAQESSAILAGPDIASRVVRGGAMRVVGFGVVNVMGVIGSVVLLRHLGVGDFGRYGTVIALVGIVSGISDAGLTITASRELALLPRGPERRQLLSAVLGVRLLLSTAAVLTAVLFAAAAGYDEAMVAGTLLAGVGAILIAAQSTLTLPLGVDLKNGLLTLSDVIKQVILVIGLLALAAAGASLVPFFAVQVAVGIGALLAVPALVDRIYIGWPSFSREAWRRLAVTALPIALASVLTVLYVRLLVVISSLLTTDFETGLFVTSARIVEMLGGFAMLLMGVILPVATVAARDDRPRLRYVVARTTHVAMLVGAAISLVCIVGARPIVIVLGGEEFEAAAPVLRLQAAAVLTIFLVYPWTAFLIADGRRRELVRCMLIGLVCVVVAGVVLISLFDAQGAALAAVLADVVLAFTVMFAVRAVSDGDWPIAAGYFARFCVALALGAAAAGAALAVAPAVAAAAIGAAVFAAAAAVLRLVPEEITALVPRPGPGEAPPRA